MQTGPCARALAAPRASAPSGALYEHRGRYDATLRVPIQATYELAQAPDALAALQQARTRGKLAIRVP